MPLPIHHMQDEPENLQEQMTRAFELLRRKHPVVETMLSSYLHGRPMDDFDVFSPSSFSNYFNQHGLLLKEILNENELKYFQKQLKYYKALVLIFGILAEDPSIMDNDENKELSKLIRLCSEKTSELRQVLSDAIDEKISSKPSRKLHHRRNRR